MDTIAIKDEEAKLIKGIIELIRPDAKPYAFGSRVTGEAMRSSDLDIVLKSDMTITSTDLFNIKELLKASPLPFSVDVMDWQNLGEGFRNAIARDLKEL